MGRRSGNPSQGAKSSGEKEFAHCFARCGAVAPIVDPAHFGTTTVGAGARLRPSPVRRAEARARRGRIC